MPSVRDKIDFAVVKEINAMLNKAFNSAYNKIAMLSLSDIKDVDRVNEIIKTSFDSVVIPVSDTVYGGIKSQYENAIRVAQKSLRSVDTSFKYNFNIKDKTMLDTLDKGNSLFLSSQYDDALKDKIISSMKELVTGDKTKKEITDDIANLLGSVGKKAVNQIGNMVVTSNTWSRSIATVNLMEVAEVTEYKYIVVNDNVTTDFCLNLIGKTGKLSDAKLLRDKYISLDRTDSTKFYNDVQNVSPDIYEDKDTGNFYTKNAITDVRKDYSKEQIMNIAGIALPPFHNFCRTEIAVITK
jgi:hypothetical protein